MLWFAMTWAAYPPPRLVMASSIAMNAIESAARPLNFSSARSPASATCSAASLASIRSYLPSLKFYWLLLRRPRRAYLHAAREASLVVLQETDDYARNVVWLQLPRALVADGVAAELRVDGAGHDVADLYLVVADFLHQRLCEAVQGELRGVVGRHTRVRVRASERRDVDDVAAAAPLHLGYGRARAVEDAEEVRLQNRAKLFGRRLLHRLEEADAGVVDEHVNAAQLFDRVSDERLALFARSHVARRARRANP